MPPPSKNKLNDKQKRFVKEYLIDLNATAAAKRAGYSEKTAYAIGQKLLKKFEIAQAIEKAMGKRAERTDINSDRVLLEFARIGFLDPRKFFNNDGSPIPVQELDDDAAACIAGLEVVEQYEFDGKEKKFTGYIKKYRLCSKVDALEKIGKHLGMFIERHKHEGLEGLVDAITAARARVQRGRPSD